MPQPPPDELRLLRALERHAATRPDHAAFVVLKDGHATTLTFAALLARAGRVAGGLQACGRDGVAFLCLRHSPDLYPAFLGCMLAGLVPAFLPFPTPKQDPTLFFEQHRELFLRTPPACLVTYPDMVGPLRDILPADVPILTGDDLERGGEVARAAAPDDVALLQHSSGTTGLKKGVALTFAQIAAQTAAYAPVAGLDEASVVVSWLPLYHDMGLFTAFLIPLALGATVVSMDAFEWVRRPASLLEAIATYRGTHAWLPNFAFEHILAGIDDDEAFDLDSVKLLASCSEPVKPATLRRFAARFPSTGGALRACYAMAEASFAVSQGGSAHDDVFAAFERDSLDVGRRPLARPAGTVATIELTGNGPPISGIEIAIGGADGIETGGTASTAVGEILLRGAFVFEAYYDAPALTAAAFRDGWYRTGDVGFLRDGELFICGRMKELVIVNGRNFYCHDIEAIVSGVSGVVPGRAVAIGVDEDAAGEQVLLIVEPSEEADGAALARAIKDRVFTVLELMPRHVELVPRGWLVKTTSGKLSRGGNLQRLELRRLEQRAGAPV